MKMLTKQMKMSEDEVEELVDRPGTTNGHVVRFFHLILSPFFGEMWFLTTGPVVGVPMILKELSK